MSAWALSRAGRELLEVRVEAIHIRKATIEDERALGRMGAALMRQHHLADPRRFVMAERPERGYGRFLVSQLDLEANRNR